ncbi:hypothetical protein AT6N2_C1564 [Agrobacterium tumefaciens]|nr:hypothetical protein AT6N2_C1564 [Agrobacterium tumefaciens]
MLAGNGDRFLRERGNLAHAEALAHQLLAQPHDAAAADGAHQAAEQTAATTSAFAIILGDQLAGAGNGFDHSGDWTICGLALEKTENHANSLFSQFRVDPRLCSDLIHDFVHSCLLLKNDANLCELTLTST